MANLPKITLITPVYNAGATLERTIKSIIAQNYPNLEYIIMDSCSTDDTAEVIDKYKSYVTRWVCEKDKGPPDAQNKGVALATGDFIQFVYADDEILPGLLHKVAVIAAQEPRTRMITCGSLMQNDNEGKPFVQAQYSASKQLEISLENALLGHVHSQFFHKGIFAEFGQLKTHSGVDFCFSNDREFLTRLVFAQVKTAIIPEPLYIFHVHSGSLSGGGSNTEKVLRQLSDFSQGLLQRPGLTETERKIVYTSIAKNETALMLLYLRQHKIMQSLQSLKKSIAASPSSCIFYLNDYAKRHFMRMVRKKTAQASQ